LMGQRRHISHLFLFCSNLFETRTKAGCYSDREGAPASSNRQMVPLEREMLSITPCSLHFYPYDLKSRRVLHFRNCYSSNFWVILRLSLWNRSVALIRNRALLNA